MSLERLLQQLGAGGPGLHVVDMSTGGGKKSLDKGVQVARLMEAAQRFVTVPVFRIGDLVTPIADSDFRGAGQPHIVIAERYDDPLVSMSEPAGSSTFGTPMQIRVLCMVGDSMVTHWVEASQFERYTGPVK